jgi:hypothetical protein
VEISLKKSGRATTVFKTVADTQGIYICIYIYVLFVYMDIYIYRYGIIYNYGILYANISSCDLKCCFINERNRTFNW